MKRKTRSVVLALVIVLSVSVAAVAVTNKDVLTATGQGAANFYGPSSSTSGNVDPTERVDNVVISSGGTPHHDVTGVQVYEANGIITYEADGVRLVHDTNTGIWHIEWDITNNLKVPITIQPSMELYGCDLSRPAGFLAGSDGGCPARGSSLDLSITSAKPSAADTTHDSTLVWMSFQATTQNIPVGSQSSNTATTVGTSVRDKYLSLNPGARNIRPAANPVELRKSVCAADTKIGTVNGKPVVLQPGESTTISSTVNSADWGFACSPLNHALINYNVQAGGSSYKAYGADQLIVFGKEDLNICGT